MILEASPLTRGDLNIAVITVQELTQRPSVWNFLYGVVAMAAGMEHLQNAKTWEVPMLSMLNELISGMGP